jgi:hypothetical protein
VTRDQDEVYSWARRNGVPTPYDFALMYDLYAGSQDDLVWAARQWMSRRIREHIGLVRDDIEDKQNQLKELEQRLKSIEEKEFT